jgi:hypothetical protein
LEAKVNEDYLRSEDQQALGTTRDRILDIIRDHERLRHGGGCCLEERIGAVAFIAHSLGLAADDDDAWRFARTIVKLVYELEHEMH